MHISQVLMLNTFLKFIFDYIKIFSIYYVMTFKGNLKLYILQFHKRLELLTFYRITKENPVANE